MQEMQPLFQDCCHMMEFISCEVRYGAVEVMLGTDGDAVACTNLRGDGGVAALPKLRGWSCRNDAHWGCSTHYGHWQRHEEC